MLEHHHSSSDLHMSWRCQSLELPLAQVCFWFVGGSKVWKVEGLGGLGDLWALILLWPPGNMGA